MCVCRKHSLNPSESTTGRLDGQRSGGWADAACEGGWHCRLRGLGMGSMGRLPWFARQRHFRRIRGFKRATAGRAFEGQRRARSFVNGTSRCPVSQYRDRQHASDRPTTSTSRAESHRHGNIGPCRNRPPRDRAQRRPEGNKGQDWRVQPVGFFPDFQPSRKHISVLLLKERSSPLAG